MNPRRVGALLTMVSNIIVGVGVIVLAFTLGRIEVTNFSVGMTPQAGVSFTVSSGTFMIGTLLIGVGILLRGVGGFLASDGQ